MERRPRLAAVTAVAGAAGAVVAAWLAWRLNREPGQRRLLLPGLIAAAVPLTLAWWRHRLLPGLVLALVAGLAATYLLPERAVDSWLRGREAELLPRAQAQLEAQIEELCRSLPTLPTWPPPATTLPHEADSHDCAGGRGTVEVPNGGDHGLLYVVGVEGRDVTGRCLNHLHGPWWEWSWLDGTDCPLGFDYHSGG